MRSLIVILLLIADAAAASLAWRLNFVLRFQSGWFPNLVPPEVVVHVEPLVLLIVFWWFLMLIRGMYKTPISISKYEEFSRCVGTVIWGMLVLFLLTYDPNAPMKVSRIFLLTYGGLLCLFMTTFRVWIRVYQRWMRRQGYGLWKTLIVGYSDLSLRLYKQLHYDPVWGFQILGFASDRKPDELPDKPKFLGLVEYLPDLIQSLKVEFVIVAPEQQSNEAILEVFDRCAEYKVRLMLVASYYEMVMGLVKSVDIHGLPLVEVSAQHVSLPVRFVKRSLDIIAASLMMVVLAIITSFIALAIKLDSVGPVFYRQSRVGRNGREFYLYKYRSMVKDAEKLSGAVWASKHDPRVTRVGKFLRRTHIDELPQFYNILKGDMSLVGPRPERRKFVDQFKELIPLYHRRMCIRPGITGWAQVRHKYDESIADVQEKTRYDLFYINHISLSLDLRILFSTIVRVLQGEGH